MRYYATIQPSDAGKAFIRDILRKYVIIGVYDAIGCVQSGDIGKYIYRDDVTGIIQVENNEQRSVREARYGSKE